jgi:mannose-1-phosphate guanylyltransferase
VQALILVGGEGTRLRPLTSTTPKPVVPLVHQPSITYQLEWLRSHGVEEVILACGFLPDRMRAVLGDGEALGLTLRYVVEPEPLGTGGALKYAEDLLAERFLMLNGDTLTDIDLTALLAQHRETGARGTLALVPVEDISAYGLVPLHADRSVREFLEKPGPDAVVDTDLINAGAYVLEREILAELPPAGTNVSIERDVFPRLVGRGLYGYEAHAYWMDLGTPDRYLKATYDILGGAVNTAVGRRITAAGGRLIPGGHRGRIVAPVIGGEGCEIAEDAIIGGNTVLGHGVRVGAGSRIAGSVLLDGVTVGESTVIQGSIVAEHVSIGAHCHIEGRVVVGAGARIGDGNTLAAGARIFPGVELPAGAIKF